MTSLEIVPDEKDPLIEYVGCSSGTSPLMYLLLAIDGFVVAYGCYLCYQTRHIRMAEFNESSQIATCIYNIFVMGAVCLPLLYGLELSHKASYILSAVGNLSVTTVTMLVLFCPKFAQVSLTQEDFRKNNLQSTFSSDGMGTSDGATNTQEDYQRQQSTKKGSSVSPAESTSDTNT